MDTLLTVMQIIALACLSVLSIYLITVLARVRTFLNSFEHDVKVLTSKAIPVFENLEIITTKIKDVTESLDDEIDMIRYSIRSVRGIADSIVDFEQRVQRRLEEPIMETASLVAGIFRGFRTFVERLRAS